MKIVDIKTKIVQAPLKTPFKTALRTVTHMKDLVVTIYTDSGDIGYGEGASTPVITGETLQGMMGAVEHIKPMLLGRDIEEFNPLLNIIERSLVHNSTIKSALNMALYDLRAKLFKVPLYKLLGGVRREFETDITISLNGIDKMLFDAQKAQELGYKILKIKVGESPKRDYERIKAIYTAFPKIILRIDANQAWSPKESVTLLQQIEREGIFAQFIEQPIPAHDFRGMRYIRERTLTPLLADEAIFSPKHAIELLEMEGCDIINIKLAKCGGITNALKIADIAQIYGVECMMGCMLEGAISIGASLHVVSAKSETITMLDLDGVNLLASNPIPTTIQFNESKIRLSNDYGIGLID